jgi:hypothetical protein
MFQRFSLVTGETARTSLIDYARESFSWKFEKDLGLHEATALADKIVTCEIGSQGLAREHGMVPWSTEIDPNKGRLIVCPIPDDMVSTMQAAREFHQTNQGEWPSEKQLDGYRQYYDDLTTLVNHLEDQQRRAGQVPSVQGSVSRVGATPGPLSVYALTGEIPIAEDKLEGVMFPVSICT